ncbi:MAG TPA: ABC transporter permease [Thermomicrobiaceae bacterium]|nr:ABC transporter permease [Thermomicrobiaceae bacterium]
MGIFGYTLRRTLLMVFVILGVVIITFTLSHVVPADPVLALVGDHAPPALVAKVRSELGLNRPLPVQFGVYVANLLHGNLGTSIADQRPVSADLAQYLPATIELSTAALLFAILVGVPTGIISAIYRNRWQDQAARIFALAGVSLPVFFTALLFLAIFYVKLGWLPGPGQLGPYTEAPPTVTGMVVIDSILAANWAALGDALSHLIMPAVVLGWASAGVIMRMMRSSLLEVMGSDYIRTARSKGLHGLTVILAHGVRNALIPTVTVVGLAYGGLLQGAVLTETIFSWPGIGRYATNSVTNIDVPAVLGVTLIAAIIYSLVNLLVDLLYAVLDPRIRLG